MKKLDKLVNDLKNGVIVNVPGVKIYEDSLEKYCGTFLIIVKVSEEKKLLANGKGTLLQDLSGVSSAEGKICDLSHENRLVINKYFPYTIPQAFGTKSATFGLGDRLGIASPGHIKTIKSHKAKPILAQQSIRELELTERKLADLIDAAAYAVLQEGYKEGYGADGDHLKKEEDIQKVLDLGFSMLTLDCSDYIPTGLQELTEEELEKQFKELPEAIQTSYLNKYEEKSFVIKNKTIYFKRKDVLRYALEYHAAIKYMVYIYDSYIYQLDRKFDFEISIDETETVTSPQAHFFVANELKNHKVSVFSVAPRFCGEFQKGIDYIGDLHQFEKELIEHVNIASFFGYKISVHSGSDKFSVFPIIAKHTAGVLHIKTAGTNWLEAIRVIAQKNPELYRSLHQYALTKFKDALAYYHVTPDLNSIPPLKETADNELSKYMDNDACRQLFHVTYGFMLTDRFDGGFTFKNEIFETLIENEEEYETSLEKHIGKHLELLNL